MWKIYPHDIETSMNERHELKYDGRCIIFSVLDDVNKRLVCVKKTINEIHRSIQYQISEINGVIAHDIFFMPQGRLSSTTSGKIQVEPFQQEYLKGTLEELYLMKLVELS
ncbi:MAG: hypothetical protein ACI8ZO_001661 [Flavobacteriales bacterium]